MRQVIFTHQVIFTLLLAFLGWGATPAQARAASSWVPSWTTANYSLEPEGLPPGNLANNTLRQTVRLSIGGERLRIVLTNANGDGPLIIGAVAISLAGPPGSPAIEPGTTRTVYFGGRSGLSIAPGKTATSDEVYLHAPPLARLSVSMHLLATPRQVTGHLRSLSSSWIGPGDQLKASALADATSVAHWYYLAAVEVKAPDSQIIVALGDSITDGSLSAPDADARWPDRLAERLAALPGKARWAIANKGIAGNRLLAYGRGPSALDRFDADVLNLPNVHTVILLEGINDLGQFAKTTQDPEAHRLMVERVIAAYRRLIHDAHMRGLRIVGATLLPDWNSDYQPTAQDEDDRQAINAWIRLPGHFDATLDWDALMRDPNDPRRLDPAYDSGDHIHPSKGYRKMADMIPLAELTR